MNTPANSFFVREWTNGNYYNLTERNVTSEAEGMKAVSNCPKGQQVELWGRWSGCGNDLIKTTNY